MTVKMMKTSPSISRIPGFLSLAALVASSLAALGHEDLSKPVITTETRKGEDGKDVLYMFIDGVKVHETDVTKQAAAPRRHAGRARRIFRASLGCHRPV